MFFFFWKYGYIEILNFLFSIRVSIYLFFSEVYVDRFRCIFLLNFFRNIEVVLLCLLIVLFLVVVFSGFYV